MTQQNGIQLYGLRHGQSEANEQGIIVSDPVAGCKGCGLTPAGRAQVSGASSAAPLGQDAVILCSPFLRTLETARLLAEARGVEDVTPDERLIERHFGTLEGSSDKCYGQVWDLDRRDPYHAHWQVESVRSVWQRFDSLWTECRRRHIDRTVVFVTHGDVLSIGACGLQQADLTTHHERFSFETAELRLLWP
ncbi:MAG: histidine phosphatase family protein [Planctomycetes bacterium]|nr:histidine phosphatase family protein [Planctomycetota bacterium]